MEAWNDGGNHERLLFLDGTSYQGEYSTSGREDICTGRERRNCGSTWVSSGVANLHNMNLNILFG